MSDDEVQKSLWQLRRQPDELSSDQRAEVSPSPIERYKSHRRNVRALNPLSKYKREEWVLMSPELAAEMLADGHPNRRVIKRVVLSYAKVMSAGNWKPGAVDVGRIVVDSRGRLVDGQHRLKAVILLNQSIWMLVVFMEPIDGEAELDLEIRNVRVRGTQVTPQTTSSVFAALGFNPNASRRSAIVAAWLTLETAGSLNDPFSTDERLEALARCPTLVNEVTVLTTSAQQKVLVPAAFGGFFVWVSFGPQNLHSQMVKFAAGYVSGNAKPGSPEKTLREYVISPAFGREREDFLLRLAAAFDARLRGRDRQLARTSKTSFQSIAMQIGKTCPPWERVRRGESDL